MAVRYSPLCDSNLSAYLAYCFVNYGTGVNKVGECGRSIDSPQFDGGVGDDGGETVALATVGRVEGKAWLDDVCRFVGAVDASGVRVSSVDSAKSSFDRLGGGCDVDFGRDRISGDCDGLRSRHSDENADGVEIASLGLGLGRVVTKGKWYEHNKKKKLNKKLKKKVVTDCVDNHSVGDDLQGSLHAKWKAENNLRRFEAERKLRLLEAQEEDALVKMQRAQVLRTTETCKVQTEKAFSVLKRTGNVVGFAETVVSDPSLTEGSSARSSGDCISPDSSVSQQEIRQMQKDNLELIKEKEDAKRYMEKVKQTDIKVHLHALRIAGEKTAYTVDTEGEIAIDAEGTLGEDGKVHVALGSRLLPNPCYKQKYRSLEECDW